MTSMQPSKRILAPAHLHARGIFGVMKLTSGNMPEHSAHSCSGLRKAASALVGSIVCAGKSAKRLCNAFSSFVERPHPHCKLGDLAGHFVHPLAIRSSVVDKLICQDGSDFRAVKVLNAQTQQLAVRLSDDRCSSKITIRSCFSTIWGANGCNGAFVDGYSGLTVITSASSRAGAPCHQKVSPAG